MKELGIYEDSLIIIMADHGGHVTPPYGFTQSGDKADQQLNPWIVAMATPLFMIKPAGSNDPFQISSAPASLYDTAATIGALLDLNETFPGKPIMELDNTRVRERSFYYYQWQRSDYVTDYVLPIQEFSVTGNVYDANNWKAINEYLPPVQNQ